MNNDLSGSFNLTYVMARNGNIPYILLSYIIPSWDLISLDNMRIDDESEEEIIYVDYEWDNVPITTRGDGGTIYYTHINNSFSIYKSNYEPISAVVTNFQSLTYLDMSVLVMLPTPTNKVMFYSKTSMTLPKAYFRVTYKKGMNI